MLTGRGKRNCTNIDEEHDAAQWVWGFLGNVVMLLCQTFLLD